MPDLSGPYDWEREALDKTYALMDALATLRHDWCQWEYELNPSDPWDCEPEW
jgi:hypothetical protein